MAANPRYPYDTGTCPRCGGPSDESRLDPGFPRPGALSRDDNRTIVCTACGQDEAVRQAFGRAVRRRDWYDSRMAVARRINGVQ